MPDPVSALERLAAATRRHPDLVVQNVVLHGDPIYISVRNRFTGTLFETITCSPEGNFVTSWGYRLGTADNVEEAAAHLAHLLVVRPA